MKYEMSFEEMLWRLQQRVDWLGERIEAKLRMDPPWDTEHDIAQRHAIAMAIDLLEGRGHSQ